MAEGIRLVSYTEGCMNMRKQIGMLVILLTLILGASGFASRAFVQLASATYMEGPITRDTLWTLVDSPFVISKDIVIYANATLTIEPGVEVQFGGNFSIAVLGRLNAIGTQDKRIEFTSNQYAPQSGDWNTIDIEGTQLSSLSYCIIEYAKNGISVRNGNAAIESCTVSRCKQNGIAATNGDLSLQNSNISLCLQNGIDATSSYVTARGNIVMQNEGGGVLVSGDGNVVIQSNTIIGNGEGIVLTGDHTTGVTISQNTVAGNKESGILIEADAHSGIVITDNTVSSNKNGIYVSTQGSTSLSNNAVSYNENGIVYDDGSHTAHRNDIYSNGLGMKVTGNATVNAEYNYWGDSSGPYHPLLNPYGRGNAADGNGNNLDFIFFLTEPMGYINIRPTARLLSDRILVRPNDTVFFASNSSDEGRIDWYLFDFDDGESTGWTTLSVFVHQYPTLGTYHANLTVMDDFGATSLKTTMTVSVQNLPPLYATIDVGESRVSETTQVPITVHVTDGSNSIENANVTVFSVKGGSFAPSSGLTNATGDFATVYSTPDIAGLTNVRIVTRASLSGYTQGSDYEYIEVLPFLSVQINPSSSAVKSEGSTSLTINVWSNDQPVANAYLTISSDNGNLSSVVGITDSYGTFPLVFTAPMTTQRLTVTITVGARRVGYIDGESSTLITVEPKVLDTSVSADPAIALSGATINVTVHVEYEMTPIEGASVAMKTENGTLSQITGLTDINGSITFELTAPAVNTQTPITVMANASMYGYVGNQGQTVIIVNPKTLNVTVRVNQPTIQTGETLNATVSVTCIEDGKPVADALVTMSSSEGSLSEQTQVTDENGRCTFLFNSPQTTAQITVVLTANVTKNGYLDGGNQTTITVTPNPVAETGGGFPIWTLLLIIIPVVIVVVLAVLIKRKVIMVSSEEEE